MLADPRRVRRMFEGRGGLLGGFVRRRLGMLVK
jgi:hypothetical protein